MNMYFVKKNEPTVKSKVLSKENILNAVNFTSICNKCKENI